MSVGASQITGISIVYSNVCSGADLRKLPRATTNVQKNKSYVGLFISYVGLIKSLVGLYNSYGGETIS